jgi:hypothetical protein
MDAVPTTLKIAVGAKSKFGSDADTVVVPVPVCQSCVSTISNLGSLSAERVLDGEPFKSLAMLQIFTA